MLVLSHQVLPEYPTCSQLLLALARSVVTQYRRGREDRRRPPASRRRGPDPCLPSPPTPAMRVAQGGRQKGRPDGAGGNPPRLRPEVTIAPSLSVSPPPHMPDEPEQVSSHNKVLAKQYLARLLAEKIGQPSRLGTDLNCVDQSCQGIDRDGSNASHSLLALARPAPDDARRPKVVTDDGEKRIPWTEMRGKRSRWEANASKNFAKVDYSKQINQEWQ